MIAVEMLAHIIIWALAFGYSFFIWNSPIMEWLKVKKIERLISIIRVKYPPHHPIKWMAEKFLYLENCAFCVSGWVLIACFLFSGFQIYFLILMVTVPWVVIMMWLPFATLKDFKYSQKVFDKQKNNSKV